MLRPARIALLVALCGLLLAPSAGGQVGVADRESMDPYWLGPYFAGLRLTNSDRAFSYGDCELASSGEGACFHPVQIQNSTSCAQNPIAVGRIPQEVFLLRGEGLAVAYGSTRVEVGTGPHTAIVLVEEPEVLGAALRELRARSQSAPEPLAAPEYPLPVLRELKRVTAAAGRFHGIAAIARATGLSPDAVRLRLRIAELLGPDALAGVPLPTMSVATVKRLGRLAFEAQSGLAGTARRHGMSTATLRTKIRRVRGLGGRC